MLFVGACNSMFYALDTATGEIIWSYDISRDGNQKSFHGRMLFDDSLVFTGTDIPTGRVYAFEKGSGKVRWSYPAGLGVYGDIVGCGDRLYALTKEDTLVCLARGTGGVIWKFHADTEGENWNDSSPCLSGDRVYFRDRNFCVYALDEAGGDLIWKKTFPDYLTTSPLFRDEGIYIGSKDRKVYRMAARTGEIEAVLHLQDVPYGTMTCAGNQLVFFTGQRSMGRMLVSIAPRLDEINWRQEAPEGGSWTTYRTHIWDDAVVVGDGLGGVTAFRIADGARLWSMEVKGTVKTIARSNGQLFIGTFEGLLYSYRVGR